MPFWVAVEYRKETLSEIEDILRTTDAQRINVATRNNQQLQEVSNFLKQNNITGIEPHVSRGSSGGCVFLFKHPNTID